jgi:hypothetical protein
MKRSSPHVPLLREPSWGLPSGFLDVLLRALQDLAAMFDRSIAIGTHTTDDIVGFTYQQGTPLPFAIVSPRSRPPAGYLLINAIDTRTRAPIAASATFGWGNTGLQMVAVSGLSAGQSATMTVLLVGGES